MNKGNHTSSCKILFDIVISLVGLGLICGGITSCNKPFPPEQYKLKSNYPNDTAGIYGRNRRVLYLILDGAEGTQVDTLNPPNIMKLTKNAVYSWLGLSGIYPPDITLPSAWTSMMTGFPSPQTKVVTGFDSANLTEYPSFVTRLQAQAPSMKVAAYSASPTFSQNLLKGAATNVLSSGDDSTVANNIINQLKNDSAIVVIGQFHSIATAGDAYGYSYNVPQYANAINKVDKYIGNIMAALKARPSFATENWLVVVSSNENGKTNTFRGDSSSAYDDTRRNSFVIFNNPRLTANEVASNGTPSTQGLSAYIDSTVLLTGHGLSAVSINVPDTKPIYQFQKGDSITIEFKLKFLGSPGNSPGGQFVMNLVSTATGFNPAEKNGWAFWSYNNGSFAGIFLYVSDGNGHYSFIQNGIDISDNLWHTLSATLAWPPTGNTVYVCMYLDGTQMISNATVVLDPSGITSQPLNIGYIPNGASNGNYNDYYITDVRYWNTALPSDIIAQYDCKTEIPENSPYYKNLIGDYRIDDGNNSKVIKDYSPTQQNGIVYDPSGAAQWQSFNDVSNAICPTPDINFYKATPNGIDIPFQIYEWLGIIPTSWGLPGQNWIYQYIDVGQQQQ